LFFFQKETETAENAALEEEEAALADQVRVQKS
jgi:hypothetical protein